MWLCYICFTLSLYPFTAATSLLWLLFLFLLVLAIPGFLAVRGYVIIAVRVVSYKRKKPQREGSTNSNSEQQRLLEEPPTTRYGSVEGIKTMWISYMCNMVDVRWGTDMMLVVAWIVQEIILLGNQFAWRLFLQHLSIEIQHESPAHQHWGEDIHIGVVRIMHTLACFPLWVME